MKKGRNSGSGREDDRAVWDYVTRSVRPYKSSKVGKSSKPAQGPSGAAPAKEPAQKQGKSQPSHNIPMERPAAVHASPKGFDRATETKLRRGQLPLEGELDLHGMTQAEAFAALHRFIRAAVKAEKRTVLVITGKGRQAESVLKRMVPLWLEEPDLARHIVATAPAQQKDGGAGALYLRLRKPRP